MLADRGRIVIADFRSPPADSALGGAVTEAFRIDLAQSRAVTLVQPDYVRQTLERMQRDPNTPLDAQVAREVAIRDGIEAVLTGDIAHAGTGFRDLGTAGIEPDRASRSWRSGRPRTIRTRILRAIDRLSHNLRRRIGESLRTIDDNEALEQVTTPSLEALRKYSQSQMANAEGDTERSIALLREAIALDTGFAMAYRRLGVLIGNSGGRRSEQVDALSRAYAHRDRLTDRERYLTLGTYHMQVSGDRERAAASYRSLLDEHPNDVVALNNLSIILSESGNFAQAEAAGAPGDRGAAGDAGVLVQPARTRRCSRASWTARKRRWRRCGPWRGRPRSRPSWRSGSRCSGATTTPPRPWCGGSPTPGARASSVQRLGQRASSPAWPPCRVGSPRRTAQLGRLVEMNDEGGRPETALFFQMVRAGIELWFRGNANRALQQADAALRRQPLSNFDPRDRPVPRHRDPLRGGRAGPTAPARS